MRPAAPVLPRLIQPGTTTVADPAVHLQVLGYVTALFVVGILAGLVFVATVPRLVHRGLREDAVHPLYGIRYWLHRIVARTTNSRFYCVVFGDSSAILHYLRLVGYRFGRPLVQSGSNFGVEVRHENPYLSGVGSGTMVSDGLSFMNAEYSNTSFRLRRAEVGARNFLGNDIAYPADARTGDNCLLATKVMVPIHGRCAATSGSRARLRSRSRGRWSATAPSTTSSTATSGAGCSGPRTGTTRRRQPCSCSRTSRPSTSSW